MAFEISNTKFQIPNKLQSQNRMIETDSALNLEFDSLELICYLVCLREAPPPGVLRRAGAPAEAGAWDLALFLAMRYALCSMLFRDGGSVRRDLPSRPPLDGPPEAGSPHTGFRIPRNQTPWSNRTSGIGQIL